MHINLPIVFSCLDSRLLWKPKYFSACSISSFSCTFVLSCFLSYAKNYSSLNFPFFVARRRHFNTGIRNVCGYYSAFTSSTIILSTKFISSFPTSILSNNISSKDSFSLFTAKRNLFLDAAQIISPHPFKKAKGGEDAAFSNWRYIGVADGVGGWECSGIDAGKYSRELLTRVQEALVEYERVNSFFPSSTSTINSSVSGNSPSSSCPSPVSILKQAYSKTKSLGSTTCCLIFLDVFGKRIRAANLGDSGFVLFRPSENAILYRSEFQCHDFNFPLQLGTGSSDMPEHCDVLEFSVKKDDWIIAATDGMWDNIYEDQIIEIIRQSPNSQTAVKILTENAIKFSQDPTWHSPFSQKERIYLNSLGDKSIGGKPDDISIVVAQIKDPWVCKRTDVPNELADYLGLDVRREEKKKLQLTKIREAKIQRKIFKEKLWQQLE